MYLEQLKEDKLPKLIVTDMYLPRITGAEFLIDLQKMHPYKKIHVIVLSTVKSDVEIAQYKQLGAVDYLQKPSSYEEYIEVAKNIKKRLLSSE